MTRTCFCTVLLLLAGCDDGSGGSTTDKDLPPTLEAGGQPADSTGPATDGAGPAADGQPAPADAGATPSDGGAAPEAGSPTPDSGSAPPAYGVICTDVSQCKAGQLCVKLASDSYSTSNPPPPKGLCLDPCTNTTAPCSSSATHYYPCIGATTWDLGSIQVCAIACYLALGSGPAKTYPCPTGTYCNRSFGSFMKICTPYK